MPIPFSLHFSPDLVGFETTLSDGFIVVKFFGD